MTAYYNEIDPYAAQWLRNLIAAGHIAPGDVDERSIKDVRPDDLKGYKQCHFFAGIGVWSYALRLAGWPDDRPVWTGSCPCQPFSAAGKGAGVTDDRHLWPDWFNLVRQCKPAVVFGEQVEAAIRHGWLDLVQADLEGIGYAFAAAGIPAAGFGAPHIRQRLWFVADAEREGPQGFQRPRYLEMCGGSQPPRSARQGRASGGVDNAIRNGRQTGGNDDARHDRQQSHAAGHVGGVADTTAGGQREHGGTSRQTGHAAQRDAVGPLANPVRGQFQETGRGSLDGVGQSGVGQECGRPGPTNGHWRNADWLHCRDGKWRPVEPGTFPLAHGASARVGRLRAYGNAIVPQVAAEVISAYMLG